MYHESKTVNLSLIKSPIMLF